MRPRRVIFSPEAEADVENMEGWLAENVSPSTAERFIERVLDFCEGLDLASARGQQRDDIRQGMRIIGFERRLTIAFTVREDRVEILRLFRAGRDWETQFRDE